MFTVRSRAKGERIVNETGSSPGAASYSIVDDITRQAVFDETFISNPPFDAVIHTASPFHYGPADPKKDMIDPAVNGTLEILRAIKALAPTVKRVVVTSSFAAVLDTSSNKTSYSGEDWNPITMKQALSGGPATYVGSKTFAERAAWDFVASEKSTFTLATVNPVLVFGPVLQLDSLSSINTSNADMCDMIQGKMKTEIAARAFHWVDVRDVALMHVFAAELETAAGKRFIAAAGKYSNNQIAQIIKNKFPEISDKLPDKIVVSGSASEFDIDTTPAREVLGIEFGTLDRAVVDTVKSLQAFAK